MADPLPAGMRRRPGTRFLGLAPYDPFDPGSVWRDALSSWGVPRAGFTYYADTLAHHRAVRLDALRAWVDQPNYGIERRRDGSTVFWLPAVI